MPVLQRCVSILAPLHTFHATDLLPASSQADWTALTTPARAAQVTQHITRDGYPAAANQLADALAKNPHDAELHAMQALCFLHMGAHSKAVQSITQACSLAPKRVAFFALQAIALTYVDNAQATKSARAALSQAQLLTDETQTHSSAYLALAHAKLALSAGAYRSAQRHVDTAVQKAPRCALTQSIQAEITLHLVGPQRALKLTQTSEPLVLKSPYMQSVGLSAQVQLGAHEPAALAACAERLEGLQASGAHIPYLLLAAAMLAHAQGHNRRALEIWDTAPAELTQMWLPAHVHRTAILVGIDPVAAANTMRTIAAGHRKHPAVRQAHVQVMQATGHTKAAKQAWGRIAQQTSGQVRNAALWNQVGTLSGPYALSEDDKTALGMLVDHDPTHSEALYQMANDALARGQHDVANTFAHKLLDAGDQTGRAQYILGMTRFGETPTQYFQQYLQASKRDEALLEEVHIYLAHEAYGNEQWDEALELLKPVLSDATDISQPQTLAYLHEQCETRLALYNAERSILASRSTLQNADAAPCELTDALTATAAALLEIETRDVAVHNQARLTLLCQKSWLHYRLEQKTEGSACLAQAHQRFRAAPELQWPTEAASARYAYWQAQVAAVRWVITSIFCALHAGGLQVMAHALYIVSESLVRYLKNRFLP